jgi:hypothetical protein
MDEYPAAPGQFEAEDIRVRSLGQVSPANDSTGMGEKMRRIRWIVVLPAIFLVSCMSKTQLLPSDVAKQVDKVFEK